MYYLVNVGYNSMAEHLTKSDREGFEDILDVADESDDNTTWNGNEEDGSVGSESE
jgi:hypothetical protein